MIRVSVEVREDLPVRIVAEGHGRRGSEGLSASCAAVSTVLKGAGLALVDERSCSVEGALDDEGRYDLTVTECRDTRWLTGLWAILREALEAISREWPGEVIFTIFEENGNGT